MFQFSSHKLVIGISLFYYCKD